MITSVSLIEPGFRFGRITVLLRIFLRKKARYVCVCDCGESKVIRGEVLARGECRSCGCFQKETGPWNRGKPGYKCKVIKKRESPAYNKLPVGSETIRKDKGKGAPRVYRKIAEPNVWRLRAVIMWEELHGATPKGHVIHHRDRNSMNDDPLNLECLTRAEHAREHARDRNLMTA